MGAIVVTGACRTGTSLMMQTLRLLGVPIVGLDYHAEFPDDGFHPHGAWEFPSTETANGIHDQTYDGKAIKLFGLQLSKSSPDSVDAVIVCRRNRSDAIASAEKMCSSRGTTMLDFGKAYDVNYICIGVFTELWAIPVLNVQFEIMVVEPEVQIVRIASFLDLEPDDTQVKAAMENVMRSKG